MNRAMNGLLIAGVAAVLAGCEWSGGGDGWNSRWNFVNFSGTYTGSPLVSEYSMTSGGSSSGGGMNIQNEAKGNIPSPQFGGHCNLTPVRPGSLTLFISGGTDGQLKDNGDGGLSGYFNLGDGATASASGSINYDNGAYSVDLGPAGASVVGKSYTLTYTVESSSGTSGSSSTPGSTKVTILSFNVQQAGNTLKIIDNNGSMYEGSFGDVSTTGGGASGGTFANGDEIIGQYSANGKSAAGINVNLVGTFQATVSGASAGTGGSQTMTLSNRRILGTWIEDGGATGNINGGAASVSVTTTVSSNSTSTATTQ